MFYKPIAKLHTKNEEKHFQTLEGHTKDALKIGSGPQKLDKVENE